MIEFEDMTIIRILFWEVRTSVDKIVATAGSVVDVVANYSDICIEVIECVTYPITLLLTDYDSVKRGLETR